MKKNILFIFLAFSILSFCFGVDFGGYIENYSMIPAETDFIEQINKLAVWFSLSPAETMYLTGQGSVGYSYNEYDILADLDYLYFAHNISNFSYTLGRFSQSEFTGKVFSHRLDGVQFDLAFSKMNLMIGAGYSGFLLKPVSILNNSQADMIDERDDDETFAPKKIIVNAGINFPDLFASQQLDLSFVGQFDMRNEDLIEDGDIADADGKGGKLNTIYVGAGLSGAITGSFIYDLYGYVQYGKSLSLIASDSKYKEKTLLAFLCGGSISYLNKDFYFSKITLSGLYASGDDDSASVYDGNTNESNTQFIPVSESKTGIIFSPILSNIIIAGLEYSLKPFSSGIMKNFQVAISGNFYFKASDGAVSENRLSSAYSASDEKYIGTEAMLILNYKPFSDFGITLAGGAFIPNTSSDSPIYSDYRNVEPGILVKASFSF